jgi:hypothetical protein
MFISPRGLRHASTSDFSWVTRASAAASIFSGWLFGNGAMLMLSPGE